ncbi:glycosyltransferase family 2 protein [Pontibacter sp. 172403-2]|uniref:cellulose synthase family protein n=1 Tax=Pontibacter rufus TaxID=2791028 RepID=UPI0018AF7C2A|nr:cellulose synthase family protein [Pontibacter sp. 172403-2]MBF9254180.1 glycosyltransferase family 2 protein [Pontibacter sp. 172403-2]
MSILDVMVITVYGCCLAFIFCYSMIQLHLTIMYWRRKNHLPAAASTTLPNQDLPMITVQLPVYNERYVIERLLDAVVAFDYPHDRLQIQILDDSTDETTAIIAAKLQEYTLSGICFEHIRRSSRTGYKAGALQDALATATGEFIAIFDADFVPAPNFLKTTLRSFTSPATGMVQTRWGHLNAGYSLLTRLQAFGLDAHFTVEQVGRNSGGHFMNFNGTAGLWRRACIEDAGGWQSDTLTEDLDLSYRAQLKGWQFVYLEETETPAELPPDMGALKSQQFRWTKGAAETARKHLTRVLQASLPVSTRLHAFFHLLNSGVFICVFLMAILSVPMLYIKNNLPELDILFNMGALLLLSLLALIGFYWTALYQQTHSARKTAQCFIPDFFLFLAISMGLSLHNSLAVLEGYLGRKTPFIRTPKYNLAQPKDSWRHRAYTMESISLLTGLEGLLALYFVFGIWADFRLHDFGFLPFHVLLTLGFGMVFSYSVFHSSRA